MRISPHGHKVSPSLSVVLNQGASIGHAQTGNIFFVGFKPIGPSGMPARKADVFPDLVPPPTARVAAARRTD